MTGRPWRRGRCEVDLAGVLAYLDDLAAELADPEACPALPEGGVEEKLAWLAGWETARRQAHTRLAGLVDQVDHAQRGEPGGLVWEAQAPRRGVGGLVIRWLAALTVRRPRPGSRRHVAAELDALRGAVFRMEAGVEELHGTVEELAERVGDLADGLGAEDEAEGAVDGEVVW